MLGLLDAGGWILALGLAVLGGVGIVELAQMFERRGLSFFPRVGVLWTVGLIVGAALHWPLGWTLWGGVAATVLAAVVLGRDPNSFEGALTTTWASLYVGFLFSFLVALRNLSDGRRLAVWFFTIIWMTDAMAFFIGRYFGRKKILPHISPSKTWAGTLAGLVSAVLTGLALASLVHLSATDGALFGAVVSVSGQVGDLLESQLKRYIGVKDSGGLLPGHGGLLDRFDSVLFALPLAYYFLKSLGIS